MKQGPISRHTKTFRSEYFWLHLLLRPNSTFSGRRRLLIVLKMLNIALLASFFLKNLPISDRFFVLLCLGIEVEFLFVGHLKVTHFPRHTETSVPLFVRQFYLRNDFRNLNKLTTRTSNIQNNCDLEHGII